MFQKPEFDGNESDENENDVDESDHDEVEIDDDNESDEEKQRGKKRKKTNAKQSKKKKSNTGKEWPVEAIVGIRILPLEGTFYYIKWRGFDSSENTWESANNLIEDGLNGMILEFLLDQEEDFPKNQTSA